MTTPTMSAVLAALGWTHKMHGAWPGRRIIRDNTGAEVGVLTAGETWELLKERGLYPMRDVDLWLDDVRDPAEHGRAGWLWAKNTDEAKRWLAVGRVRRASLDHDLGAELRTETPFAGTVIVAVECTDPEAGREWRETMERLARKPRCA